MLLLWPEKRKGAKIFIDACVDGLSMLTACPIARMSHVCVEEKSGIDSHWFRSNDNYNYF